MFDFKKAIYNNESYKNITLELKSTGVELVDEESRVKTYLPFYNLYSVEQKKTTQLWLKILLGTTSLLLSLILFQSLQFTLQTFSMYGMFQFIMLIIISLSIGYLFAISVLYVCIKNEIMVWHSIILKNDAAKIKLLYKSEVKQQKAYDQIRRTIEELN